MKQSNNYGPGDVLHRLVKQTIDSGACKSLAEAEALFQRYRLHVSISAEDAASPEHQASLLTCIALARRVCLGGVTVEGVSNADLTVPMPLGRTLQDAVRALGGIVAPRAEGTPTITVGHTPQPRREGFHVRTTYSGWRGGIVPAHSELNASGSKAMPLACMLAAALAVNEAFLSMSTAAPLWGRRVSGLSLWDVNPETDWLTAAAGEPLLAYLPSRLWLIGLGHLGQAYLWALGLLAFPDPSEVSIVLQDTDIITPSTESTSILTDASLVGQKKTRAMASWAEHRGFATTIQERIFDASFQRQPGEPAIALCGIDNAIGRSALDRVGFDFVVEAGLGRGHRDFQTMRLHTLPGTRPATALWQTRVGAQEDLIDREAYRRMLQDGALDRCGVTLLAGRAVGAPFVGAAAASLALAEVLRLLHGGSQYQLVELDLQCIEHRTAVLHSSDFSRFNPGYVKSAA